MLQPRYQWVLPDPIPAPPALLDAARRVGLTERSAALLVARGVASAGDLERWFADPVAALHDPALLPDAGRFVRRIGEARGRRERVIVFGDFDADGLTGLAILVLALRRLGLDVVPYVPSRLEEGHGLSLAAIEKARELGAGLIVTVDCGTTSGSEIAVAAGQGIDVVVTDHHHVPADLPPALAVVNPQRPDATYPDRRLSGSGVAFKCAQLLLAGEPDGPGFALSLADLATIGTVADVAPIVGENRAIARLGLDRIRAGARPGIAALLASSGIAAPAVDLDTMSFALAPRLNAAGRMGEALDAAQLLLAEDGTMAAMFASRLEAANLARRELTKSAIAQARAAVATLELPAATVVRGSWPVGIVGLVAGKLVEEFGRPAVVGADLGTVVRASCRGDGVLNLAAALDGCGDLLLRHGGHAAAAGFEIPTARWDEFVARFSAIAAAVPGSTARTLRIDLALAAAHVDYGLFRELGRLAPWGPGNPAPVLAITGLTVTRVRAANGGHTQLTLRRERDVLDGIAFGWAELAGQVVEGDRVDIAARLTSRAFGGFESLQLEIVDVAPPGSRREAAGIAAGDAGRAVVGSAEGPIR